jgi:chemotaxis signal transduction protein
MEEFRPLLLKHYLVFKVANEKFAIDILDVESIQSSRRKMIFDDIDDLKISVRIYKRLVPIINLRKKMHLKGAESIHPSLVFLKYRESADNPVIGIQVDETVEIIETMVPKKANGKSTRLIKALVGINQEVLMVLRIKDIINNDELVSTRSSVLN